MVDRRLTTFDATLLAMGGILGIGIFFTPQFVADRVHEEWAFLTMWIVGGLFALAAAMTFAEWGATLPHAGGWYVFLRESLGRLPAFLFAWTVLLVVSTGAIATVAQFAAGAIDGALVHVELEPATQSWIAAGLVTAVTLACLTGAKSSALFQNAIMVVKLLAIGALVVAGWAFVTPFEVAGSIEAVTPPASGNPAPVASGMLASLLPVFFAYGGWQMVCYIAPQVQNPERTLPRAILFGVTGVIVVYVLLASSYLRVLGIDGIASDPAFATTLGDRVFGAKGVVALNIGFAISATGWLVVTVLSSPWLYVAMSREGLFFESFGKCNRRNAPVRALVLQWAIAMVFGLRRAGLPGRFRRVQRVDLPRLGGLGTDAISAATPRCAEALPEPAVSTRPARLPRSSDTRGGEPNRRRGHSGDLAGRRGARGRAGGVCDLDALGLGREGVIPHRVAASATSPRSASQPRSTVPR